MYSVWTKLAGSKLERDVGGQSFKVCISHTMIDMSTSISTGSYSLCVVQNEVSLS